MRYRIRWAKRGKLRFLSHHDEALVFERAARRGGVPLDYSKGFSPHPKIAFGSGLPVGFGSEVELLDVGLTQPLATDELIARFNQGLPEGLEVLAAVPLAPGAVSLGAVIMAADYLIATDAQWLDAGVAKFMSLTSYEIEKPYKGSTRVDDLRGGVLSAEVADGRLEMRCAIKPRSVRPSDVLSAIAVLMEEPEPAARFQRVALLTRVGEGFVLLDEHYQGSKVAS
ncbi:MAG: TIGR03936 family radical SAM-associated protein [Actinomycetota bacterium]